MPIFEMIKYHKRQYPLNIPIKAEEIAGHFDVKDIAPNMPYSLHTEYSYGKRTFSNPILTNCPNVVAAQKSGIPQLWYSEQWAKEFAHYIIQLTKGDTFSPPKYIEIHPPFSDYTDSLSVFLQRYCIFEDIIFSTFPDVQLLIENRCGSVYHGGRFVISKAKDIIEFANLLEQKKLKLNITLDVPQLYTAHNMGIRNIHLYADLLDELIPVRSRFEGVHLWGKRKSDMGRIVAHQGDLNTYFDNETSIKQAFLNALFNLFDDGVMRNMVLEVNDGNDYVLSIIKDLKSVGFQFV